MVSVFRDSLYVPAMLCSFPDLSWFRGLPLVMEAEALRFLVFTRSGVSAKAHGLVLSSGNLGSWVVTRRRFPVFFSRKAL